MERAAREQERLKQLDPERAVASSVKVEEAPHEHAPTGEVRNEGQDGAQEAVRNEGQDATHDGAQDAWEELHLSELSEAQQKRALAQFYADVDQVRVEQVRESQLRDLNQKLIYWVESQGFALFLKSYQYLLVLEPARAVLESELQLVRKDCAGAENERELEVHFDVEDANGQHSAQLERLSTSFAPEQCVREGKLRVSRTEENGERRLLVEVAFEHASVHWSTAADISSLAIKLKEPSQDQALEKSLLLAVAAESPRTQRRSLSAENYGFEPQHLVVITRARN